MEFLPQHRDDALVRPAQRDVRHELAGDREVVDRGRLDGFAEGPEVVSGDGVRMAEEGEEFTQVLDAAARVRPVEAGEESAVPDQDEGAFVALGEGAGRVGARHVSRRVRVTGVRVGLAVHGERARDAGRIERRACRRLPVGTDRDLGGRPLVEEGHRSGDVSVPAVDNPLVDVLGLVAEVGEDSGDQAEVGNGAVAQTVPQLLHFNTEHETVVVEQGDGTVMREFQPADNQLCHS